MPGADHQTAYQPAAVTCTPTAQLPSQADGKAHHTSASPSGTRRAAASKHQEAKPDARTGSQDGSSSGAGMCVWGVCLKNAQDLMLWNLPCHQRSEEDPYQNSLSGCSGNSCCVLCVVQHKDAQRDILLPLCRTITSRLKSSADHTSPTAVQGMSAGELCSC